MKIAPIICLKLILLLLVSCTFSEKEITNKSLVENGDEYFQVGDEVSDLEEKGSVFQVMGLGCKSLQYGTGFFVEENIVVTNAHVVAGVNSPKIIHDSDEYDSSDNDVDDDDNDDDEQTYHDMITSKAKVAIVMMMMMSKLVKMMKMSLQFSAKIWLQN